MVAMVFELASGITFGNNLSIFTWNNELLCKDQIPNFASNKYAII